MAMVCLGFRFCFLEFLSVLIPPRDAEVEEQNSANTIEAQIRNFSFYRNQNIRFAEFMEFYDRSLAFQMFEFEIQNKRECER